jgi:HEAT repeat protein
MNEMCIAIRIVTTTLLCSCIPVPLHGAEPTIAELIVALRDEDAAASAEAADALGNRAAESAPAIKALVQSLSDERVSQSPPQILIPAPALRVADSAVAALINIGQPAVPELAAALDRTSNAKVRHRAIMVISRLELHAPDAVPAIERALSDKEDHIRLAAAEALGTIQRDGQSLVQALFPLLSDKSPDVRAAAVRSVGRSRTESAVSQLIPLLKDKGERWFAYTPDMVGTVPVRLDVVQSLGKIGTMPRRHCRS